MPQLQTSTPRQTQSSLHFTSVFPSTVFTGENLSEYTQFSPPHTLLSHPDGGKVPHPVPWPLLLAYLSAQVPSKIHSAYPNLQALCAVLQVFCLVRSLASCTIIQISDSCLTLLSTHFPQCPDLPPNFSLDQKAHPACQTSTSYLPDLFHLSHSRCLDPT